MEHTTQQQAPAERHIGSPKQAKCSLGDMYILLTRRNQSTNKSTSPSMRRTEFTSSAKLNNKIVPYQCIIKPYFPKASLVAMAIKMIRILLSYLIVRVISIR